MYKAILLTAASACLSVSYASAQASANVDVSATIVGPTTDLEVSPVSSLAFGEVAKPNGIIPGGYCSYDATVTFSGTRLYVSSRNSDGTRDSVNASNCKGEGVNIPSYAELDVTCSPDIPVFYTIDYAGTESGIMLTPSVIGGSFRITDPSGVGDTDAPIVTPVGNSLAREHICYEGGDVNFIIGAALNVYEDAPIGSDLDVGTITLSASYN